MEEGTLFSALGLQRAIYEALAKGNPGLEAAVADLKWLDTAEDGQKYLHFKAGLKLHGQGQRIGPRALLASAAV